MVSSKQFLIYINATRSLWILVITSFISLFITAQEDQISPVIEISSSYADHQGKPWQVKKDSLYIFRTDLIFLVNSKTYNFYTDLFSDYEKENETANALLEKYKSTVERNMELERNLRTNFEENDSLDRMIYERTQTTLTNTQKALDYTINSLESATKSLNIVDDEISRRKKKKLLENVLFVFAGIGAGVLVGVSL